MLRKPGRPMKEYQALEKALSRIGGLREVVNRFGSDGLTVAQMAEELAKMTGLPVNKRTLYNWVGRWRKEDAKKEQVTA